MAQLRLSIATTDYDQFRDFRLGPVKAEGIDLNSEEIFPEGIMTQVVI
jgi:hypothetical protein